jgi:hypothetical protein
MSAAQKTAILAQVGHFYFGAVGQFYVGANSWLGGCVIELDDFVPETAERFAQYLARAKRMEA